MNSNNKTVKLYNNLNTVLHLAGMPGFWVQSVNLPPAFVLIYGIFVKILDKILGIFAVMIFLALFTHNDVSLNQRFTKQIDSFTIPASYAYYVVLIRARDVINVILYQLEVLSKEIHINKAVEKRMILSIIISTLTYTSAGVFILLRDGISMIRNYLSGYPALSVITVWPDIYDGSQLAQSARLIIFVLWILLSYRMVACHMLIYTILSGLSQEFKYLQNYFYSLDNIFKRNISQDEKDHEYLHAFKRGIKLHIETLRCTRSCQSVCGIIFNNEVLAVTQLMVPVIYNIILSKSNNMENIPVSIGYLAICSVFWCLAGDIKVEAYKVSTAMYCSGWNHCSTKQTASLRKMFVISMMQAQQPVVLLAFRHIELTYETFVNIVRSAYVAFILLN